MIPENENSTIATDAFSCKMWCSSCEETRLWSLWICWEQLVQTMGLACLVLESGWYCAWTYDYVLCS